METAAVGIRINQLLPSALTKDGDYFAELRQPSYLEIVLPVQVKYLITFMWLMARDHHCLAEIG